MEESGRSIITKANIKTLFISLGFLIFIYIIFSANDDYFYNVIYGPFTKTSQELSSVIDLIKEKELFVKIIGENIYDSGIAQIEQIINKNTNTVESETTIGFYQLLLLDDKFLVLYSKKQDTSTQRIGELKPLSSNLRTEILQSTEMEDGEWLLPFLLDTTPYSTCAYIVFVFVIPVTIISLFNFINSLRRSLDPTKHPIYKAAVAEVLWLEEHQGTEYDNNAPTCDNCSFHKKLIYSTYRSNVSYFFERKESIVQGNYCFLCSSKLFKHTTLITIFGTWWGIIGLFIGPVYIIQNLYNYFRMLIIYLSTK